MKKIFVIAGVASGDLHGSNLIKSLREISPAPLEIHGIGGEKIKETGALGFFDLARLSVTGLTEAVRRLSQYQEASKIILNKIKAARPNLVVLIDNPGFNLHLAQKTYSLDIPIAYYIAPQIWAWAPKRILKIKKYVKKVLVVFEFEKKIYEDHGVPVAWVGHPLKDLISNTKAVLKNHMGPLVSLLPGSRKGELKMLFSIFAKAAKIISEKVPYTRFSLIKSPTLSKEFYNRLIKENGVECSLVEENSYGVIESSDLAIVCSGTATLECALLGTPMIISNKGSFLTYIAVKSLIRVPFLGLPNLILGEKKFPELLQYDATPEKIAKEAIKILTQKNVEETMKKDLKKVSAKLGEAGANKRAAEEILKMLRN